MVAAVVVVAAIGGRPSPGEIPFGYEHFLFGYS